MELEVRCLTCTKTWKQPVKAELNFPKVIAFDFCFACKQKQGKEFERQFKEAKCTPVRSAGEK